MLDEPKLSFLEFYVSAETSLKIEKVFYATNDLSLSLSPKEKHHPLEFWPCQQVVMCDVSTTVLWFQS